jgi:hypothetical protein
MVAVPPLDFLPLDQVLAKIAKGQPITRADRQLVESRLIALTGGDPPELIEAARALLPHMLAAGVQVTEVQLRAAFAYVPAERLRRYPAEYAESFARWQKLGPAALHDAFRRDLEQHQRDAAAACAPLTDEDIEAEIDAARRERAA